MTTSTGLHFISSFRHPRTDSQLFTVRETGDRYLVRPSIPRGYECRYQGDCIVIRPTRAECLDYMEQHALLGYVTAQSESAWNELDA